MVNQVIVNQRSCRGILPRKSLQNSRKEGQCRLWRIGVLQLQPLSTCIRIYTYLFKVAEHTATTLRSPSSTSLSFLLSSIFLICCAGNGFVLLRGPASRAASRVKSRAVSGISFGCGSSQRMLSILLAVLALGAYLSPASSLYARLTPSCHRLAGCSSGKCDQRNAAARVVMRPSQ